MQVSIDVAAGTLRELIEAVRGGEEVILIDGDLPVARLELATRSVFRFGLLAHLLQGPIPDFLEPMDEEELALWEGRGPEDPRRTCFWTPTPSLGRCKAPVG